MNVIAKSRLIRFWTRNPDARAPLTAWYAIASRADWDTPQDIRDQFNSADFIGDNRVIFDIGGNNYRLVARISYRFKNKMIKFVGTHADYDRINPETI